MIQSGGFLGNLLGKLAGPLMKVAMPLAKNVLAPLGLSAAMSASDRSIDGVLLNGVSETVQHEAKEQRGGFLGMLLL